MRNSLSKFGLDKADVGIRSTIALVQAFYLAQRGIAVAPADAAMVPLDEPSRSHTDLRYWAETYPLANYVAPCGRKYGLLVLDVNETRYNNIEHENGPLFIPSWRSRREDTRVHAWFRLASVGKEIEKLTRGPFRWAIFPKAFVPLPGSVNQKASDPYRWDGNFAPGLCDLGRMSDDWEWALRRDSRPPQKESVKEVSPSAGPPEFDPSKTAKWDGLHKDYED